MAVTIARPALDAILAHAAASGDEVCGLLLGAGDAIHAARPTANVAADPAHRFEIDPAAHFAALRAQRGGGPAVIGHYHSHPNGLARPSACDAAMAAPGRALWLIVADGAVTAWRFTAEEFVALAMRVAASDGCETFAQSPQGRP